MGLHAFLLQAKGDGKKVAAHVWSADEKLQLKVYTTAPALQFYSGNFLGGTPSRGTEPYADWQGLALESEFLPDSPNHPELIVFPLRKGIEQIAFAT